MGPFAGAPEREEPAGDGRAFKWLARTSKGGTCVERFELRKSSPHCDVRSGGRRAACVGAGGLSEELSSEIDDGLEVPAAPVFYQDSDS